MEPAWQADTSAVVEEDGQVFFLEDIYKHDKALAKFEAQAYFSRN
jgi:murein L,D-transpeptidase YcbB/YkuD